MEQLKPMAHRLQKRSAKFRFRAARAARSVPHPIMTKKPLVLSAETGISWPKRVETGRKVVEVVGERRMEQDEED